MSLRKPPSEQPLTRERDAGKNNGNHSALQGLPKLYALLQQRGYTLSPARWLAVEDMLFKLHCQGRLAEGPSAFASHIACLVCRNPDEQQRFAGLYRAWLQDVAHPQTGTAAIPTPSPTPENTRSGIDHIKPQAGLVRAGQRLSQIKRRTFGGFAALLIIGLLGLWGYRSINLTPAIPEGPSPVKPTPQPSTGQAPVVQPEASEQVLQAIPPNTQAIEPQLVGPWLRDWQLTQVLLPLLPMLIFFPWLWWQWRRRRVIVDYLKDPKNQSFERLHLHLAEGVLFSARALAAPLRQSLTYTLRRLHPKRTAERSAHNAAYTPVYRQRQERPEYLFLVDKAYQQDNRTALAKGLAAQLKAQQVVLHRYQFNQNPLWCYPEDGGQGRIALKHLAQRYPNARLIVTGDAKGLFHPLSGKLQPWAAQFKRWQRRAWLSTQPQPWAYREAQLALQGFAVAPLNQQGVSAIAHWWWQKGMAREWQNKPGLWFSAPSLSASAPPAPLFSAAAAEQYIQAKPPKQFKPAEFCRQLRRHLPSQAYRLLCACAAYPALEGQLTLALDIQLFSDAPSASVQREQRLHALLNLPWFKQGRLPAYIRRALINSQSKAELSEAGRAYLAIFKRAQSSPGSPTDASSRNRLALPITHQPKDRAWWLLKNLLRYAPAGRSPLADRLFAQVVLAGKRGPLYFVLPHFISQLLPGKRWQLATPLCMGALAAIFTAGLFYASQGPYKTPLEQWHMQRMAAHYGEFKLAIYADAPAQALAQSLRAQLIAQGFKAPQAILPLETASAPAVVNANKAADNAVAALGTLIQHLSYGEWRLQRQPLTGAATKNEITLRLSGALQGGKPFRDQDIPHTTYNQNRKLRDLQVFRDVLTDQSLGPAMVALPAGEFLMGSPEDEIERSNNEGPQHKVTIKPFAIGQSEVTFEDYAKFIQATNATLPNDYGWGQGKRPVINVSWQNAQSYAAWLSEQTGLNYRLPSEAEWEYAARAGTTTAFNTGPCINAEQANFYDTAGYKYADCPSSGEYKQQTQPVATYPANGFGLYDMHGNVREWVEDCYHENYSGAPTDGSAWLEKDLVKNCALRVLRGGSWYDWPRNLRSANRSRSAPNERDINTGFRLARTL